MGFVIKTIPGGLMSAWLSRAKAGDRLTLTGPLDAQRIRELTAWATQNDNLPEALSVQPRSLEDVFLEVSGGNAS